MAQSTTSPSVVPADDPFDILLTLEDTLYTTAYELGTQDGAHAGRIEGRIFGLEKGFEKFAALGRLHGRAGVWAARLPDSKPHAQPSRIESNEPETERDGNVGGDASNEAGVLPILKENTRLHSHISTLHALTDPSTFSTLNTEDAVADYDDRFKRAGAKAKIIERIAPITTAAAANLPTSTLAPDGSPSPKKGKSRTIRLKGEGEGEKQRKSDDNIEDFADSRF